MSARQCAGPHPANRLRSLQQADSIDVVCCPPHLLLCAASLGPWLGAGGQVAGGHSHGVRQCGQRPPGRLQPVRQARPGRGCGQCGPAAHRQQQLVQQRLHGKRQGGRGY